MTKLVGVVSVLCIAALAPAEDVDVSRQYQSNFLRVSLAQHEATFVELAVDSLGKKKLAANPLRHRMAPSTVFEVRRNGQWIEYRPAGASLNTPPAWAFEFLPRQIRVRTTYSARNPLPSLVLDFDSNISHVTLLGLMTDDGSVRLPALLHIPDYGTFRITASRDEGLALGYDALRYPDRHEDDYVHVTFPSASHARPRIEYTLDVVAIHPNLPELARDARFDGFRRNWLNIFQLNPRLRLLANNAASDPCAFTVYMYADMASHTPPLAPGLTALDLIRKTLDRYLGGAKSYGIAGYYSDGTTLYDFLDTYPSLLIAAADYIQGSNDETWLQKNYAGLKAWATKMLAMDREGDGLLEYPASGDSGSWPEKLTLYPANWWDAIGFGHKDAYSNALAYRALLRMAEIARLAQKPGDVKVYTNRAQKLRSAYLRTFYNPDSGLLAGWKSGDGKLHDYYFTFVNTVAITCGLVPWDKANEIMDRLLSKMKEVGYTHFEYGLPGNLVPIRRADYVDLDKKAGGPQREDGSDGFQIFENGGATACYAYFTLQALYQLGRRREADAILFPMLRAFEKGGFQGRGPNNMTYEWRAWDGTPTGYEGLLVDGYMTLLAALARDAAPSELSQPVR